jgi:hypothetical protein
MKVNGYRDISNGYSVHLQLRSTNNAQTVFLIIQRLHSVFIQYYRLYKSQLRKLTNLVGRPTDTGLTLGAKLAHTTRASSASLLEAAVPLQPADASPCLCIPGAAGIFNYYRLYIEYQQLQCIWHGFIRVINYTVLTHRRTLAVNDFVYSLSNCFCESLTLFAFLLLITSSDRNTSWAGRTHSQSGNSRPLT